MSRDERAAEYQTYAEYLKHPRFREACRLVVERSGGACERCGGRAVDFHHVRYCRWGQFDPPDNLLHLCRACHEYAHRCVTCGGMTKARDIKARSNQCTPCREARNGR